MVRNNNMIPNNHFHKDWQRLVRVRLIQPMRKKRRYLARVAKVKRSIPIPIDKLRPIVRCPSFRYNSKTRLGRGFSLKELKAAGINKHYARTIGIAVDQRRRNVSMETLRANVMRLNSFTSKIELINYCDNNTKKGVGRKGLGWINVRGRGFGYEFVSQVKDNVLVKHVVGCKAYIPTEEEKSFKAFETLRKARNEGKKLRRKLKKKEKDNITEFGK